MERSQKGFDFKNYQKSEPTSFYYSGYQERVFNDLVKLKALNCYKDITDIFMVIVCYFC